MKTKLQVEETYNVEWLNIDLNEEENGCKLLDCKVIDENIKLRLENIKFKKIAEKLAEELSKHIWLNDKDAILKIYREKVEEDETYS